MFQNRRRTVAGLSQCTEFVVYLLCQFSVDPASTDPLPPNAANRRLKGHKSDLYKWTSVRSKGKQLSICKADHEGQDVIMPNCTASVYLH